MIPTNITIQDQWYSIVVYSENSQTFMMEPLLKIVKCFQPLTMFVKSSLLYVWLGSECASSLEIKGTMPTADILLIASSAWENWCCHMWSQYDKSFSRYHEKAVSTTIDGMTTT